MNNNCGTGADNSGTISCNSGTVTTNGANGTAGTLLMIPAASRGEP